MCGAAPVLADPPVHPPVAPAAPAAAAAELVRSDAPAIPALTIPALTVVELVIDADLGSKTSHSGETFPIALHRPLVIDGREVLPAGTTGRGEVVWAKKSGGSGSSGELVLAARYLDVDGRRLRLRSMHLAEVGQDKFNTVNAINIATAATVPVASIVGFFLSGKQAFVTKGTIAAAKTAEDFNLPKNINLDGAAVEDKSAAPSARGGGALPPPATGGEK